MADTQISTCGESEINHDIHILDELVHLERVCG